MRFCLKKPAALLAACALCASGAHAALAQQDRAAVRITGAVSPALKLSTVRITDGAGVHATVEVSGLDSAIVTLEGNGQGSAARITIPLEIRTNVAYELKEETLYAEGCAPDVIASANSIRASGAGVAPKAIDESKKQEPINFTGQMNPTGQQNAGVLITGPRVSLAGNFTSSNNALLVNLDIDLNNQTRGCRWRLVFRLSLRQSPRL
ncbi:MAG TPA: hypothetical protein VNN73_02365 [Blastocatellia bacterium]|nr:hypothetical protein [Blastocatellia bacterium]